jgi:hypothetical protein
MNLIPPEFLIELGRIFTGGSEKYYDHNWRQGMKYSQLLSAAQRHIVKDQMGIQTCPELGTSNLAMAAWNLLVLDVFRRQGLGTNDLMLPETMTIDEMGQWVELEDSQALMNRRHNDKIHAINRAEYDMRPEETPVPRAVPERKVVMVRDMESGVGDRVKIAESNDLCTDFVYRGDTVEYEVVALESHVNATIYPILIKDGYGEVDWPCTNSIISVTTPTSFERKDTV